MEHLYHSPEDDHCTAAEILSPGLVHRGGFLKDLKTSSLKSLNSLEDLFCLSYNYFIICFSI